MSDEQQVASEIPDEHLDQVAGGCTLGACTKCGGEMKPDGYALGHLWYKCVECGYRR